MTIVASAGISWKSALPGIRCWRRRGGWPTHGTLTVPKGQQRQRKQPAPTPLCHSVPATRKAARTCKHHGSKSSRNAAPEHSTWVDTGAGDWSYSANTLASLAGRESTRDKTVTTPWRAIYLTLANGTFMHSCRDTAACETHLHVWQRGGRPPACRLP